MEQQKNYKLVGTMNLFKTSPDFVWPVFERNNEYYFQNAMGQSIESFTKVTGDKHLRLIEFIANKPNNYRFLGGKEEYTIGDEPAVAFALVENDILVSDLSSFLGFMQDFVTDDTILRKQIGEFILDYGTEDDIKRYQKRFGQ